MKVSVATLALFSAATLLLHAERVESAMRLRVRDDASVERQVPVQVNEQTATLGWRAPVVDKTHPSEPADVHNRQHQRDAAVFATEKKAPHGPHTRNKASDAKAHSTAKSRASKSSAHTKKALKQTKQHSKGRANDADEHAHVLHKNDAAGQPKRRAPKDKTPPSEENRDKHSLASKAALSAPRQVPSTRVSAATGDSINAAHNSDAMNHQAYSELQIGAEVRAAGAAVMTQMAESFRAESNKSLAFIGAVSGLVVGVVVIVIALVALSRQHSEFTVVDFESDLPEADSGRIADVRQAEEEASARPKMAADTGVEADTHTVAQAASAEDLARGDDDDDTESSSISV